MYATKEKQLNIIEFAHIEKGKVFATLTRQQQATIIRDTIHNVR